MGRVASGETLGYTLPKCRDYLVDGTLRIPTDSEDGDRTVAEIDVYSMVSRALMNRNITPDHFSALKDRRQCSASSVVDLNTIDGDGDASCARGAFFRAGYVFFSTVVRRAECIP